MNTKDDKISTMQSRLSLSIMGGAFALWFSLLLSPTYAQPTVQPALVWPVKAGNPTIIEQPKEWSGYMGVVEFSPDGQSLVTGGGSWGNETSPRRGMVLLWDAQSGAPKGELRGHNDIVQSVVFSPDGNLLATQSQDGALFIWDAATRTLRHRLSESLKVKDTKSRMLLPRLIIGAWSPDSKMLATFETKFDLSSKPPGYSYTIKIFNAASGQVLRSFGPHPGYLGKIAWAPDGKNLLIHPLNVGKGTTELSAIDTIDAQSGATLSRSRLTGNIANDPHILAFSTDARYAVVNIYQRGPDNKQTATETVLMWDLENDRATWTKTVPRGTVRSAELSHDGKTLVIGNADGEIVLYNAATGIAQQTLPANDCSGVSSLAFSPDARRIAHVDEGLSSTHLWNLDAPLPMPRFASQTILRELYNVRALSWSGDIVSAVSEISDDEKDLRVGRELRIQTWNAATGKVEAQTIAEKRLMSQAALSPDGTQLAIVLGTQPRPAFFETEGIGIYDLQGGELLRVLPEKYGISSLAWSPDGKTLATNLYESTVTMWNPATGDKQRILPTEAQTIAFSPDGSLLAAGSEDGSVQFFDARSGQEKETWQIQGTVKRLAFAPDGKTLALGATPPENTQPTASSVQLFDVKTGQKKRQFAAQSALRHLSWTPDGSGIAASSLPDVNRSSNGQLRVWDAATGEERVAIDDRCGLEDFVFSPDGKRVITYTWNRMRVWDLK